jgi:hypothetical protein
MVAHGLTELPDEPDIVEIFQPSHGFRYAVFGFKDYAAGGGYDTRLSGNSELGGETGLDMGDGFQQHKESA